MACLFVMPRDLMEAATIDGAGHLRAFQGDMRVMFLLWDATSGNKSLKIVEIPIKTAPRALNNPDFPEQ